MVKILKSSWESSKSNLLDNQVQRQMKDAMMKIQDKKTDEMITEQIALCDAEIAKFPVEAVPAKEDAPAQK